MIHCRYMYTGVYMHTHILCTYIHTIVSTTATTIATSTTNMFGSIGAARRELG